MRSIYALTFLLASSLITEAGEKHYSRAFGKTYTFEISADALKRTPIWRDDFDNPPVSARKAIKLADEMRLGLVKDTEDFKWFRQSAAIYFLEYSDRCVWEVVYEARFQNGGVEGRQPRLSLFVLMDGTVVPPEVSVDPRR